MAEPMEVLKIGTDEFECVDAQLRTGVDTLKAMFGNGSIFGAASGSIAQIDDAADFNLKALSCVAEINPVQSGSGDPAPTNPRPISGFSSVNVTSVGKNLVDSDDYYESYKQADGSYISKGSEANAVVIPISPALIGKQVTFSASLRKPEGSTIGAIRVICYVNGVQTNGNNVTGSNYETSSITFTPVTANDYVKISYGSSGGQNMQYKDVQLELGSSATTYEEYTGKEDILDLGQTVYCGHVNFSTGEMVIDKVKEIRRWDSARSSGSNLGSYWRKSFELVNETVASTTDTLCSVAPYLTSYSSDTLHYYIDSSKRLMLYLPSNTSDDYQFEICYPLAEPQTVQLTPKELEILKGNVNVWADTGDIDIKYFKNLQIIQDLIALKNDLVGVG